MNPLSAYMSEAATRALPEEVAEKTKQHILDTLAAMISGSKLLPGQRSLQFAEAYGGRPMSAVVASKLSCGAIEAALANGVLAHADETDDSHSPSQSHPGCAVVPGALAVGEQFGISGTHFIRAVALGYDIGTRVTMTLGGQEFEAATGAPTVSLLSSARLPRQAAPQASTPSRCAGCWVTRHSNLRASDPGIATPITSRRHFFLVA
jgi:2-methylcitrate dehydratase PrpD